MKDYTCFQDALPRLVEVYAKQILNLDADIAVGKKAHDTSEACVKKIVAFASRRSGGS